MSLNEVITFVNSVYSGEIKLNDNQIISPHEVGIYIPEKKLVIEFCDLYNNSSASPGFKRNTNRDKALACQKVGVNLFLFFGDEWINKRELIEAMIKYRLGLVTNKLHARKCEVKHFSRAAELKNFFERNHLDGYTNSTGAYGLLYDGKVVAAMSMRTNHKSETEIARFCTDRDVIVNGAASKLLGLLPRPIITFSNNRLSSGAVYKSNGLEEITQTTAPSYYYTDLVERVWRYKCKRLNPPDKISQEEFNKFPTETSQATNGIFSRKIFGDSRPLYRIEDCAHRKWILK